MGSIEVECFFEKLNSEPKQVRYELPANAAKMVGEVFSGMGKHHVLLTAFSRKIGDSVMVLVSKASTLGQLYDEYDTYSLTAFDCIPIGLFDFFVYCSRSFSEFGR